MRVEGELPEYFDIKGVLHTKPKMSERDYLNAKHGANPNYDPAHAQVDGVITVEEPTDGVVNDYSRDAISDSAFNRRLNGDSEPVKFGSLEVDHGVW